MDNKKLKIAGGAIGGVVSIVCWVVALSFMQLRAGGLIFIVWYTIFFVSISIVIGAITAEALFSPSFSIRKNIHKLFFPLFLLLATICLLFPFREKIFSELDKSSKRPSGFGPLIAVFKASLNNIFS